MHLVLVTEIWGKTSHVDTMVDAFQRVVSEVSVIDPFDGVAPCFSNEEEAYVRYLDVCGHRKYARRLTQALAQAVEPVFLVGFSAGAGAVWSVVGDEDLGNVQGAVCFYGSSIRSMIEVTPSIQTDLIFPNHESHYNVDEVIQGMQEKEMVQCYKTHYGHGFMNPLSDNYSEKAYQEWFAWLHKRVNSII